MCIINNNIHSKNKLDICKIKFIQEGFLAFLKPAVRGKIKETKLKAEIKIKMGDSKTGLGINCKPIAKEGEEWCESSQTGRGPESASTCLKSRTCRLGPASTKFHTKGR